TSILRLGEAPPPRADARVGIASIPGDTLSPVAPYRLVNIGAGQPAKLTTLVEELEKALGVEATKILKPLPPGDVVKTFASADLLEAITGQKPGTPLSVGIP
ncbi:MAG TPA: NAD-dependent dehydratase, partial [Rhabdaerophilum sp.]|nr:NAD-dependent dehydratase [Rhabdaerophilum sp.]